MKRLDLRQTFGIVSTEQAKQYWRDSGMEAERRRDAARLRDELSSICFYAERAKAAEARTGDLLSYWMGLMASQVNRYRSI